ncbi:c-type cytochrome [Agaribacterium haliotis]|uniref:c-type cytochrome n=1 Tax=Agaribacterium haliotis TaxID=2013869 RepID=UPI000BB538D0|nr:c-type cytochrome [Agaribacterium haliotis]
MKTFLSTLLMLSLSALSYAEAPAKEAACRACHGAGGAEPIAPSYPKLNGQNQAYLETSMKAYKSGDRKGGMASIMTAQMATLSDADIKALAEYYSKQK